MKSNITLKLDKALIREARIVAAENDTSISALLASYLEKAITQRRAYHLGRKNALARLDKGLDFHWNRPTSRDELHER